VFVERRADNVERRNTSLKSVIVGAFRPHRRAGRRASDRHFPIEWHDPYLPFLALAMLLLSVTDAFMTVTLLTRGVEEAYLLLAFMLNEHPNLFAAIKMALKGFGIVLLVAVARIRLLGLISVRLVFQSLMLVYLSLLVYEIWLVTTVSPASAR